MNGRDLTRDDATDRTVSADDVATDSVNDPVTSLGVQDAPPRWEARLEIERHRAETERLQLLVDFLTRPIHAHGGSDPDPDVVTAYNLAVEAALNGVRRAAASPSIPVVR